MAKEVRNTLPETCYSVLQSTGELIVIRRDESGYYPTTWNTSDKKKNEEMANIRNKTLGVSVAQRKAMEIGAMFGWDVPGTDPEHWTEILERQDADS